VTVITITASNFGLVMGKECYSCVARIQILSICRQAWELKGYNLKKESLWYKYTILW